MTLTLSVLQHKAKSQINAEGWSTKFLSHQGKRGVTRIKARNRAKKCYSSSANSGYGGYGSIKTFMKNIKKIKGLVLTLPVYFDSECLQVSYRALTPTKNTIIDVSRFLECSTVLANHAVRFNDIKYLTGRLAG